MNLAFDYGDTRIEFELTYRKRKTMSIMVEPPGVVTVVAPAGTPENLVLERVKTKAQWIVSKLQEVREVTQVDTAKEFVSGESFKYMGRNYSLNLIVDTTIRKPDVDLDGNNLIVISPSRDEGVVQKAVEAWYRAMAKEQINTRIMHYQTKTGVAPNSIMIKDQKKRWGSCSTSGNVYFNWRVIMAPADVVDYVVVHELCHLVHHNHSADFWKLVSTVMPDYQVRKEWLIKNGAKMSL